MRTRFDVQLLFGARASLKLASPRQPRPCGFRRRMPTGAVRRVATRES